MNIIFTKPTARSLKDLSKRHKNKERRKIWMPTRDQKGEVRFVSSKKENQRAFCA